MYCSAHVSGCSGCISRTNLGSLTLIEGETSIFAHYVILDICTTVTITFSRDET